MNKRVAAKNLAFGLLVVSILLLPSVFTQNFKEKARPLESASSLDAFISAAANKKLVMLGESTHGTHEFYAWRNLISRRLIAEHNFNFIVVEGDFASLYELNRYVKHLPGAARSARQVLTKLDHWPTWTWSNTEIEALADWLRDYNKERAPEQRVGFYGLDVYDEWRSQKAVLDFLKKHNRTLYRQVRKEYSCFSHYKKHSWNYARAAVKDLRTSCAEAVEKVVQLVEQNRVLLEKLSDDDYFYLLQNAHVAQQAERFYRLALASKDESSWNARVEHMHNTVNRLLALYGENSKGIVWAHNSHIGDASYTTMIQTNNQNIGRLARKQLGRDEVFLAGFTAYIGKVQAASSWNAEMQTLQIPAAIDESLEGRLQATGLDAFYLVFDEQDRDSDEMLAPLGNRAIGVVYNPVDDAAQYEPSIVPLRYDALVFFEETTALEPLR